MMTDADLSMIDAPLMTTDNAA
jgi:hypothetical protein